MSSIVPSQNGKHVEQVNAREKPYIITNSKNWFDRFNAWGWNTVHLKEISKLLNKQRKTKRKGSVILFAHPGGGSLRNTFHKLKDDFYISYVALKDHDLCPTIKDFKNAHPDPGDVPAEWLRSNLDYALAYAAAGYAVFPLAPNSKRTLKGSHGYLDATTDPEKIREWWTKEPLCNIATSCIGFVVIDIDKHLGKADGGANLLSLRDFRKFPANTPHAISASGMHHYFFKEPVLSSGESIAGSLTSGVDVKHRGGYVVLAPSCVNGREYRWMPGKSLFECEPQGMPDWARKRVVKTGYASAGGDGKVAAVLVEDDSEPNQARFIEYLRQCAETYEKTEDATRFTVACKGKDSGLSHAVVLELMTEHYPTDGDTDKLTKKVANAYQYSRGKQGNDHPKVEFADITTSTEVPEALLPAEVAKSSIGQSTDADAIEDASDEGVEGGSNKLPSRKSLLPELRPEALFGFVGEVIRDVTAESEADPAAVLLTFLTRYGCHVGNKTFVNVGDTKHAPCLFTGIVGKTARARKGTSADPVEKMFGPITPQIRSAYSGLSSGEGIIYAMRDRADQPDGRGQYDEGVLDKRLFIMEGELAGALSIMQRPGNTLSAVLRCAWDGKPLEPLTKNNRTKATGGHLCWVGHITVSDLQKLLAANDVSNGWGNRVLWVWAERRKLIAIPKALNTERLKHFSRLIQERLDQLQGLGSVQFSDDACDLWESIYADLTVEEQGQYGDATARAEAQVMRLALIYALLPGTGSVTDGYSANNHELLPETDKSAIGTSAIISKSHLESALAVWEYCNASARLIFAGSKSVNSEAGKLIDALRCDPAKPLTKTYISREIYKGNVDKQKLDKILVELEQRDLIEIEIKKNEANKTKTTWIKAKYLADGGRVKLEYYRD